MATTKTKAMKKRSERKPRKQYAGVVDIGTKSARADLYNGNGSRRISHHTFDNKDLVTVNSNGEAQINMNRVSNLCDWIGATFGYFQDICTNKHGAFLKHAVATEILRQLNENDRQRVVQRFQDVLDLELRIITGAEEVSLYAKAALPVIPKPFDESGFVVAHLGHGSFDIAYANKDGEIVSSRTSHYGLLNRSDAVDAVVYEAIEEMRTDGIHMAARICLCGSALRDFMSALRREPYPGSKTTTSNSDAPILIKREEFLNRCEPLQRIWHLGNTDSFYCYQLLGALVESLPRMRSLIVAPDGMRQVLARELIENRVMPVSNGGLVLSSLAA